MTIIYNHISHSAQCHYIKHVSCISTCQNLESFHNCHTYSNIAHIQSISPCQTVYKVVNFIGFKYDVHIYHVDRMSSNYIIHSFYVDMGYFA